MTATTDSQPTVWVTIKARLIDADGHTLREGRCTVSEDNLDRELAWLHRNAASGGMTLEYNLHY